MTPSTIQKSSSASIADETGDSNGAAESSLSAADVLPSSASASHSDASFKNRLLYSVVIPLVLLAGAVAILMALGTVTIPERPPADTTQIGRLRALPPVRVARIRSLESTGQPLYLVVDGTVVPYREAKVAAEVAGRIVFKSDDCEAGSYVNRDQLLMKIDPTDHELEVQRLTRLREQEYQALQELDQEMVNSKRLIEVAQQDVALQRQDVERQTSLPIGFASRTEIDQASRSLLAATQQLVSQENQLELQRKKRIRLEASERLAATQLQAAEINLKRTEIRAPIEGVIVSEDADLNTFVSRASDLLTIEDTSKVEVATSLRMDQLYWILDQREGRVAETSRGYDLPETRAVIEYELSGREGAVTRWEGRLLSYDGIGLDPATRTVPVRVVVDDPSAFVDAEGSPKKASGATPLVRGMFVRVKLLLKPKTPLVVIPSAALQPGNRIFQFIPERSVLDTTTTVNNPHKGESADSQTADSQSSGSQSSGSQSSGSQSSGSQTADSPANAEPEAPFDPNRWEPGKVVVRKSVLPVDALSLDKFAGSQQANLGFDVGTKMWVCEIRDAEAFEDFYVVVSPLGSVDDENFPVRADRQGIESVVGSESTTSHDEPVISVATGREDA